MSKYRVTASAIGSYFYTYVDASSPEEAQEIAIANDDWDYELAEPFLDEDDVVAERISTEEAN